jgi:Protein of unknown function (DUF4013)
VNNSVDIGKAFTHVFDDPDWFTKSLVGSLVALVPILNFTLMGYEVRVIRNIVKGDPRPMPQWNDIGDLFMDGLWLGLARIIYSIPLLLLFLPFFLIFFLPFFLILITGGETENFDQLFGAGMSIGLLVMFCGLGLALIYGLILGIASPAVAANYAKHGTFASCFDIQAILGFIQRNVSNVIMVWLSGFGAGMLYLMISGFISFIPCFGTLLSIPLSAFSFFYIYMITGHAIGQALLYDAGPALPSAGVTV